MIAAVLLTLCPCSQGSQQIESALQAGDYAQAWNQASLLADPLERAQGRAEILFRAGDPAGALQAAREGLAIAPGQLELLHRATAAAVWLGEPQATLEWAGRLSDAVKAAQLAPEHRSAWEAAAQEFGAAGKRLEQAQGARMEALRRARITVWVTLIGLAGGAGLALTRTAPRPPGQGRSSRPVS